MGAERKPDGTIGTIGTTLPAAPWWATACIVAANLLWALNYVIAKRTVADLPGLAIAAVRMPVASLLLLAALPLVGVARRLPSGAWRQLAFNGAALAGNQVLFIVGLERTTPGHAALISATMPVIIALIARVRLGERLALLPAVGMALSMAGVGVLVARADHAATPGDSSLTGDLLTLGAVICFALYVVGVRDVLADGRVRAASATAWAHLFGAPWALAAGGWSALHAPWRHVTPVGRAGFGYFVLGASVTAYLVHSLALSRMGATRAAAFNYLQPPVTATVSVALGFEQWTPLKSLGGILVLGGLGLVDVARWLRAARARVEGLTGGGRG
jgi:drug/metabolite transporter (DMT)-like permease